MSNNKTKKTIIIGAGLGGLVHGILLKKARPGDEIIIYDANKIPGGFCTAFEKVVKTGNEKVKYTVNIPLLTSDFGQGEPFDKLFEYMGVKNIKWTIKKKLFQYYPLNEKPFLVTPNIDQEILKLTSNEKEKQSIIKFFNFMSEFYNDLFHKAQVNPTFLQALKMLFKIPKTVFTLMKKITYLDLLKTIGIKTQTIKEIFSSAEAFLGVDVDKVSAQAEMCMLQSFLENNAEQPANDYNFQDISDNLAQRFKEIGGKLILNTKVDSILFDKKKAIGVTIKNEKIIADHVILAVSQDRIEELIKGGEHISKISKLIKKIRKIPYPNSDYYCYYLIEKKVVDENPRLIDIAYHIYKLPEGLDESNWRLAMYIPNKLYNNKYYVLSMVMVEQDQKKITEWINLRKTDYAKYTKEKEKISDKYLKQLQLVEPLFKKHPPVKSILTFTPASYKPYGSNYPICGLAQTPDNFLLTRMKVKLLNNLFISAGASFSGGLWGAIAGGWQGFVISYKKMFGIEIGNHDVIYKPGLKNLP